MVIVWETCIDSIRDCIFQQFSISSVSCSVPPTHHTMPGVWYFFFFFFSFLCFFGSLFGSISLFSICEKFRQHKKSEGKGERMLVG